MCDDLQVIYASDRNYVGQTAISAVSLLKRNPHAHILLLGYKLERDAIETVKTRVENQNGTFEYVDTSPFVDALRSAGTTPCSYATYSRFFIPGFLSNRTGRVLYLDCDTLIVDSVSKLFAMDLHGRPLALGFDAVHPAYKKVISLPSDKPYFNAGVMLIDLDVWRRNRCTERLLDELHHPHGRLPLCDQDVIVRTLNDEIEPLDRRWNFLSQYLLTGDRTKPAIYHFSGNTLGRPWLTSSRHPMRESYRRAAADAGLSAVAEQRHPMPIEYKIQYWLYRLLPQAIFTPICNLMYRMHIWLTYGV